MDDDNPKPAKPKFSLPNYADDNKLDFEAGLAQEEEMEFKEQNPSKFEPKTQKPRLGSASSNNVDGRSGSAPNNNRPRGGGMKHGQGRNQNQQPKRQQIVYDEDPF